MKEVDPEKTPTGSRVPVSRGRPREFNEADVLEHAMDLFWYKGYQGIGMSEMVQHMGISRQSLYNT